MMPTSRRDFPCILSFTSLFFISLVDWIRIAPLSVRRHWLPMDPAKHADVSCSSSHALAMSPYIYLMTHISFIASLSHTYFSTFAHIPLCACSTVDHMAGSASDARPGSLVKKGPGWVVPSLNVPTLYSTLACNAMSPLLLAHPFPPKTVHTFHYIPMPMPHTLHLAATSSSLPDRRTFPVPMNLVLYAPTTE